MMTQNNFLFFLLLVINFASFKTYAIDYQIIGPCSSTPIYSETFEVQDLLVNVGQISLTIFNEKNIAYQGSESGFSSINHTKTGKESIEIISKNSMRAYGWCYSVNGIIPDLLASDYFFSKKNDSLVWFYAYSTYENGNWIDYCVPSYNIKADQFCHTEK